MDDGGVVLSRGRDCCAYRIHRVNCLGRLINGLLGGGGFRRSSSCAMVIAAVCFGSACSSVKPDPPFACVQSTQAAATTGARIVYPANGATGIDPYAPFSWTADSKASAYGLCIGTKAGASDVWASEVVGTSTSVPGLQPNTPYYLTLQVKSADGAFALESGTFTSGTGLAHFTTPVDGDNDVDPLTPFAWTGVLDAEMYRIALSTTQPGGADAYDSLQLPNITSLAYKTLQPNTVYYQNGSSLSLPTLKPKTKYYARLITQKAGVPFNVDITFTTGNGIAHLQNPEDGVGGVGVAGASTVFSWNSVPDADAGYSYKLSLGSAPGLPDVWTVGPTSDSSAELPARMLKADTTYYVRLSTRKHGTWRSIDSAFSTGSFSSGAFSGSNILYPPDDATNVDPLAPIVWSSLPGSPQFDLYVGDGTTVGVNDRNYGFEQTSQTSFVASLIGGKTYHATLWTESTEPSKGCSSSSPCFYTHSITFTTAPLPLPHNNDSFYQNIAAATAAVRNMAGPIDNSPLDSTFLKNNLAPGDGQVAFCTDFAINLAIQLHSVGIVARRHDMVFGAGPASHSTVEYYDPIQGKWGAADATFGFVLYDGSKNPPTMSADDVGPALEQGLSGSIPFQFVTSASIVPGCPQCSGSYFAETFLTDPILDYLNPVDLETGVAASNDPTKFLIDSTSSVGVEGVYAFSFANPTDSALVLSDGVQFAVGPQSVPWPGKNFGNLSAAFKVGSGWGFVTAPPSRMVIEKQSCPLFAGPNCR
jgi:hypothetical protein